MRKAAVVAIGATLFGACAAGARKFVIEHMQEPWARALGAIGMLQRVKEWPSAPVGTQFCSVHRKQEDLVGSYTDCYECGHVYSTYQELVETHKFVYRNIGGKREIGIITYCPLCLHDF